jgi:hypothetical protein
MMIPVRSPNTWGDMIINQHIIVDNMSILNIPYVKLSCGTPNFINHPQVIIIFIGAIETIPEW